MPLWTCLLAHLLTCFRNQPLAFVLETTPLDDRAGVVYLGLVVHSRLPPVGWQGRPWHDTWKARQWAIVAAWLDHVIPSVGAADCTLLADSDLAGWPVVPLCQNRQWHYLLRLASPHPCRPHRGPRAGRWSARS